MMTILNVFGTTQKSLKDAFNLQTLYYIICVIFAAASAHSEPDKVKSKGKKSESKESPPEEKPEEKPEKKPEQNTETKQDDWTTEPAENILFPETYLSSIKRVLENASQNASSLPLVAKGPSQTKAITVSSLKGKQPNEDEEDDEDEEAAAKIQNKNSASNDTSKGNVCSNIIRK